VEEQDEVAVAADVLVERAEHGAAHRRRRHRLLGVAVAPPQLAEVRHVVVGVDLPPAERQHRDAVEPARPRAGGGAVGEAEPGEQRGAALGQAAAGRAEAGGIAERGAGAREQLALAAGLELRPGLVAPAVAGDLVARGGEPGQRLGVELAVEPLEEERRTDVLRSQHAEQLRQRLADAEVLAERPALRPRPALELGRLAEVVEGDRDGGRHGRSVAASALA
jgi:hypothetical protein